MVAQRLVSNATVGHDSGVNSSTASVSVWVKYRLYILAALFVVGFLVGYSTWNFNCSTPSSLPQCNFPPSSLGLLFAILFALVGAVLPRKRRSQNRGARQVDSDTHFDKAAENFSYRVVQILRAIPIPAPKSSIPPVNQRAGM